MESKPMIYEGDSGRHNADLEKTIRRLEDNQSWKDLSHIVVVPAGKKVPTPAVFSWMNLIKPPNNRSAFMGTIDAEVGHAYSEFVTKILKDPGMRDWKYLVTLEHDNCPPADGLVKLLYRMEENPDLAAIGGLYFTKGEGGFAQIWGDPDDPVFNFRPQPPARTGLKHCNGVAMGFTVFRLDMFKDPMLRRPWFKTEASQEGGGWTQDLYFWMDAHKLGYKCAVDCDVRVGHWDDDNKVMW